MALRSAELASLEVPQSAWDGVQHWLEHGPSLSAAGRSCIVTTRWPPIPRRRATAVEPSNTMTSVGLLMRMYTGWRRDNPDLIRGAEHLRQNLPEIGSPGDARRDTYYWYYATQVMFHMRGRVLGTLE